ncbi:unnamed protein product [Camellia sinensis]
MLLNDLYQYLFRRRKTGSGAGEDNISDAPNDSTNHIKSVVEKEPSDSPSNLVFASSREDFEDEDDVVEISPHGKQPVPIQGSTRKTTSASIQLKPKRPRKIGPMDCFFTPEPELRAYVRIARWIYDTGIPFNVVNNESFAPMIEAIGQFDPGLKPPSYHMIRIPYLKKEVNHVHKLMKEHKEDWAKYGCSMMCDGWTDRKHRTSINFLVNCPRGTMFLESIDASSYSKDANKIFSLLDKFVDKIGEANVVQIVTDSAATNVLAGKFLEPQAKYEKAEGLFQIPMAIRQRSTRVPVKKGNKLAQKRLNDLVFVKYNRALKRRYMKRANIDPISLKDIDESNEWLIGRMENELVFDDDSLGWDDVAVAAGVEESNQRTRSSTTRTTHQQLVDEEDEWEDEDEDEAEEEDVDGYKSNDDDDGGDEVLHVDDDHNFTDGMALGSAFLLYGSVGGWSRNLFLLAHELPQEIGDFGILVRSNFSVSKALFFNFLSALVALAGTALALVMGQDPGQSSLIEGFTAGGFVYIAVAGVLAEMNNGSSLAIKCKAFQFTSRNIWNGSCALYIPC